MPEQSADPIPRDLAEAFDNAVELYDIWRWGPSQPERKVSCNGQDFSMTAVCGLVDQFTDRLPDRVFLKLRSYMHDYPHGKLIADLEADQSYATGARCLRRMIEMDIEANRQREEWRQDRK